jgi:ribosomal protein S21
MDIKKIEPTFDPIFENMLKKIKRESEEIIREVKERRYYIKPSMKKRLAKKGKNRRNK